MRGEFGVGKAELCLIKKFQFFEDNLNAWQEVLNEIRVPSVSDVSNSKNTFKKGGTLKNF